MLKYLLLLVSLSFALKPQAVPPGGLTPKQVPQFIFIGVDDNNHDEAMLIYDLLKQVDKPIKMSFYFIGQGVFPAVWDLLGKDGHELGVHTQTHPYLSKESKAKVENEILTAKSIYDFNGRSKLFRSPTFAWDTISAGNTYDWCGNGAILKSEIFEDTLVIWNRKVYLNDTVKVYFSSQVILDFGIYEIKGVDALEGQPVIAKKDVYNHKDSVTVSRIDERTYVINGTVTVDTIYKNETTNFTCESIHDITPLEGSEVVGFRHPYLDISDTALSVLENNGFTYDCSIEAGAGKMYDGTNYVWPYTMDTQPDDVVENYPHLEFTPHPDLWQIPAYPLTIPTKAEAAKLGYDVDLVTEMKKNPKFTFENGNKITGLDYNLMYDARLEATYINLILKHNLHQRLNSNRAPFTYGIHPAYYRGGPYKDSLIGFLNYALTIPEVRFVTGKELIDWMENPKPLSSSSVEQKGYSLENNYVNLDGTTLRMRLNASHTVLNVYNLNGKLLLRKSFSAGSHRMDLQKEFSTGLVYVEVLNSQELLFKKVIKISK